MKLVIATKNEHKRLEMEAILAHMDIEVVDLNQIGFEGDIEEDGLTFRENACIKAKAISLLVDDLVMADDSGLEIDAFDKEPGIYSARYLGHDTPYAIKNQIILERMKDIENRSARFVSAIALYHKGTLAHLSEATFEGEIDQEATGQAGFGYDPIFYFPPLEKSAAEMSVEEKNEVSHRGKAMKDMITYLRKSVL